MKSSWFFTAVLILLAGGVGEVRADLITSPSQISGASFAVDFDQFNTIPAANQTFPGVNFMYVGSGVSLEDGITLTSPSSAFPPLGENSAAVVGNDFYSLGSNGEQDPAGRNAFVGLNDVGGNLIFTFSSPVSEVGAYLNYAPGLGAASGVGDATISALSSNGSVLASYDLETLAPISTPGGVNASAFRGIVLSSNSIAAFEVSNSAIVVDGLLVGVPEPASAALLGIGLLGLLCHSQRRRTRRK